MPTQVGPPVLYFDRSVPAPLLHIIARSPSSTNLTPSLLLRPFPRPSLLQQSLWCRHSSCSFFAAAGGCCCRTVWCLGPSVALAFALRHPYISVYSSIENTPFAPYLRLGRSGSEKEQESCFAANCDHCYIQASNRASFDPCVTTRHLSSRRSHCTASLGTIRLLTLSWDPCLVPFSPPVVNSPFPRARRRLDCLVRPPASRNERAYSYFEYFEYSTA